MGQGGRESRGLFSIYAAMLTFVRNQDNNSAEFSTLMTIDESSRLHVRAPKAEGGDMKHEGQPKEKVLAKP